MDDSKSQSRGPALDSAQWRDGSKTKIDETTGNVIATGPAHATEEINKRLRSVLDKAPSDSSAELFVRRSPSGYKGMLKVFSSGRRFLGGGSGPKFSEVIDQIFGEVNEQINEWKRHRFDDEKT